MNDNITRKPGIYIILFLLLLSISDSYSQEEIVKVQTLTFDSITTRRGVWKFPDNDDTYRKIIMYYTLKCDPRTTRDRFDCGEWDYLTYTRVYEHTGVMDSTLKEHPFFKVGVTDPDTLKYTTQPTQTTYYENRFSMVLDNVISEEEFIVGDGTEEIALDAERAHIQFLMTRNELKDLGVTKGDFKRLKLYFKNVTAQLNDFTVKLVNASGKEVENFELTGLKTYYQKTTSFTNDSWNTIDFLEPFNWNGFSSVLVDISYNTTDGQDDIVLLGYDSENAIATGGSIDAFLELDGTNDYADAGVITDLDNAQSYTYETWIRVDAWQNWNRVIGRGDKCMIQLGDKKGDIYGIVRNTQNTWGKTSAILTLGEWAHIAMVFDGSGETNSEKLKIYFNGAERTLQFNGDLPSTAPELDLPFTLTNNTPGNSSLKGALDEVRVWGKALDEATINEWMYKEIDNSHPDYQDLVLYYPLNEMTGTEITDHSTNGYKASMIGVPAWKEYKPHEMVKNFNVLTSKPNIVFLRGEYESHIDTSSVEFVEENPMISITKYRIEGYAPVPFETTYAWASGWTFTYGPDGSKTDSLFVEHTDLLVNDTLEYYAEPFEVLNPWEIGRFITPYGINLDLGPEGFTWFYDVTDYAHMLRGDVELSAGNNQELIDLRFEFIKGTPPRDVVNIQRPWGPMKSIRYRDLSNDEQLDEVDLKLDPDAAQFKVKTRFTGHGHNSNDGNYPHCCEWKDNTHTLYANTAKVADWHIWQENECAMNPVFPQGGTWPGSREGWCPGDVVKDFEFEVTKYVDSDMLELDYEITPVPANNQGMGNGNYIVAMHLIEYSEANFDNDLEVYDVIAPNDFQYYSRINPICSNPIVKIRNNGTSDVSSLTLKYKVSGGIEETYNWTSSTGPITKNETRMIELPLSGNAFWLGDDDHNFTITVSDPNGNQDEYSDNDTYTTHFDMPDLYSRDIVIWYQANLRASHFTLQIKDINGEVVFSKNNTTNNTLYKMPVELPYGCYTLELIDQYNYGLSYWAYPDQGSGFLRIHDEQENLLKSFNPDCGHGVFYSFSLGDVQHVSDPGFENTIVVFPNPAAENVNVQVGYQLGESLMSLYDSMGRLISSENVYVDENFEKIIDTRGMSPGSYFIRFTNGRYDLQQKIIKK